MKIPTLSQLWCKRRYVLSGTFLAGTHVEVLAKHGQMFTLDGEKTFSVSKLMYLKCIYEV